MVQEISPQSLQSLQAPCQNCCCHLLWLCQLLPLLQLQLLYLPLVLPVLMMVLLVVVVVVVVV